MLCCKFSEQRLRLLQIARVEPFREPAVDRSKQFARLLRLTLVAPEAREAHGCAEFPGFCLLHSRDRQCTYLGMTFLMRTTAPLGQYIACGSLIIGCDSSVASSGTPSIATIDCACEGIISTAISLSSAQKRQSNRSTTCPDDRRYGFLSARRQHPLQQRYQSCGHAFTLTAIAEVHDISIGHRPEALDRPQIHQADAAPAVRGYLALKRDSVDYLLLFVFVVFVFPWSRFTASSHEGTDLLNRQGTIFIGIHRLEDFFVSGLKFLQ